MKKVIITYGLISGAIVSVMLFVSMPLFQRGLLHHDNGMYVGFASMIIAFSLIFFAIKSYRDKYLNGSISFGMGFTVGILITLIGSVVYAVSWDIIVRTMWPNFAEWYNQLQLEQLSNKGVSDQEIAEAKLEMEKFASMYANPFIRFGFTVMEIFPVGLIITIISAGVLRKKDFLPAE
ncbi:MAG: DUF4199 domain-containing protein [Flammeovirgaceae bacterium]|nr:MAG: DUF4199 domain-containing protein [Flammeovirgaceae bacterium]